MYKLVIMESKKTIEWYSSLSDVHNRCAEIEKKAHKIHSIIIVECYYNSIRVFDRFLG